MKEGVEEQGGEVAQRGVVGRRVRDQDVGRRQRRVPPLAGQPQGLAQ